MWYEANRPYLHAGADGLLTIDDEAKTLGLAFGSTNFFERAFAMVQSGGDKAEAARHLLNRYAPDGPATIAPLEQWQSWWKENASYLFFTDFGGYKWMIDPLARKRRVPSSQLVGPARETPPNERVGTESRPGR